MTRPNRQTFHLGPYTFDVDKALELTNSTPTFQVPTAALAPLLGWIAVDTDAARVMPPEVLNTPLLMATSAGGNRLLIDGYHRLSLARHLDRDTLPAVALTAQESQDIQTGSQRWGAAVTDTPTQTRRGAPRCNSPKSR